ARHWCYAYQIGTESVNYRANDDGEPNNSAGMPIYRQIQSFDLTNVLVLVVRYFGGVKLGVSGLINAYRTAANMALTATQIVERTIDKHFKVEFEYVHINIVMRIIKEQQLKIIDQKMEESCMLEISVRKGNALVIFNNFNKIHGVTISEL
ncbi:MAG: YigZ family protein, partial [Bacteroidota bacterium]